MTKLTMQKVLCLVTLFAGFALAQMDLSTPNGDSVLVTFESDPMGAEVYVADTFIGRTPTSVRINRDTPTRYKVLIQESDYGVNEGYIEASEDRTVNVYLPRGSSQTTPSSPTPASPPSTSENRPALAGPMPVGSPQWCIASHVVDRTYSTVIDCDSYSNQLPGQKFCVRMSVSDLSTVQFFLQLALDEFIDSGELTPLNSWTEDDGFLSRQFSLDGNILVIGYARMQDGSLTGSPELMMVYVSPEQIQSELER